MEIEFETALGHCLARWEGEKLVLFSLPSEERRTDSVTYEAPAHVCELVKRVRDYFSGKPDDFLDVILDWPRVSDFQRRVYIETQNIPRGHTCSYGEISQKLGLGPEGSRAVGAALGANPWPLFVPCHRVLAANGKMTGFSAPGGIRTKTRMLALEGAELLSE